MRFVTLCIHFGNKKAGKLTAYGEQYICNKLLVVQMRYLSFSYGGDACLTVSVKEGVP